MSDDFWTPYPDYNVIAKESTPSWNDITRSVVNQRVQQVPKRRFLEPQEYRNLEAACDRILPQPDRLHKVPIAPWIDHKLSMNKTDGFRYDRTPPLREAWRLGLEGLAEESEIRFGIDFSSLPDSRKDSVLSCISQDDTRSAIWERFSAKQFFNSRLLFDCISVYYASPESWSEIGFGGPASPRGYVRLKADARDPWEAPSAHPKTKGDANNG